MFKALLLSLFIVPLSHAQIPEAPEIIIPVFVPSPVENCIPGVLPALPFEDTATQIGRNCSPLNIRARKDNAKGTFSYADLKSKFEDRMQSLQMHLETDSKDFCPCIKSLKFNDIKVPENFRTTFHQDHFNKSYGKTLKKALDEVLQNTTKFKNLNLPKEESNNLHDRSKSLCVPAMLATQLQQLKQKSGTKDCPSSSEDFSKKMNHVFGTSELDNLTETITDNNIGLSGNSCISRQMYMHFRSSHQSSTYGLANVSENQSLKEFFHAFGKLQLPDLLSYDLFFNLGYRDNDFKNLLARKLPNGSSDSSYQQIYTDPEVLSGAFTSIDNSCKKITDNLKDFVCTDSIPKVSEKTLNLIANDALNMPGLDSISKQATIDHFLNEKVCDNPRELSAQDLKFDELMDSTLLQSRGGSKDILSSEPTSEYSKFNKQFCQGREGKPITPEDLPSMMKGYFETVKDKVDLASFFSNQEIQNLLNLKVDVNANPMFSSMIDPANKLPEISQILWRNKILPKLKEKGLSEDEIHQLYAIIEMQTNIRIREVREVREQLKSRHPNATALSDVELDRLMRQDTASVNSTMPGMDDMKSDIRTVYQGQQTSRRERFNEAGSSQVVEEPVTRTLESSDTPIVASVSNSPDQPDTSKSDSSRAESSARSLSVSPTPQGFTSSGTSGSTSNTDSAIADERSDSSENQSQGSRDFPSKSYKSDDDSSSANLINDDIQKIRDQIKASQEEYNRISKEFDSLNQQKPSSSVRKTRPSQQRGMANSDYKFPKNVPIKSKKDGKYFVPESGSGSELSSASQEQMNTGVQGPAGSSGGGTAEAGISGAGAAALASLGGMSSKGMRGDGSRNPASLSSPLANLPVFEHPQIIPHSIFDIVGSIDKVVLLLGLEGKTFKTIEGIEEFDKETGKLKINYLQRTYDFIPQGKFSNLKERFQTKESREEVYKSLFTYPRTKENLVTSKKYALATREVAKEEVSHSYVLQIQNNILSDDEIRDTIKKVMEQIK